MAVCSKATGLEREIKMGFGSKLIGQPILFYSEGTVYEMQLNVDSHKVKCIINQK